MHLGPGRSFSKGASTGLFLSDLFGIHGVTGWGDWAFRVLGVGGFGGLRDSVIKLQHESG